MKKLVFFIFFVFPVVSFAQRAKIDSLLVLLKSDVIDTNNLIHLVRIAEKYNEIGKYDSVFFYSDLVQERSKSIVAGANNSEIKNSAKRSEANTFNNLGSMNYFQGNFSEALNAFSILLKLKKELNDKNGIGYAYNNIGNVYTALGNYPEALKNHLVSLKTRELLGDKKGIADSYNNIGLIYYVQQNFEQALKNLNTALALRKTIDDQKGISASYNNIGNVYNAQKKYKEALSAHFESIKIKQGLGDKKGESSSLNNIGVVYSSLLDFPNALKFFSASLKIKEMIGSKPGIASSCLNIGTVLVNLKKYDEANGYLIRARDLSIQIGYKENLRNTYFELVSLDSAIGNYKGAYENNLKYVIYKDSLDNEETRKKTIQSQMTFDFEKKEAVADAEHKKELENQEIIAQQKSRKQKLVIGFVISGFLLVLIFAGFIFRSLKITRRQKSLIEKQKDLVENQKQVVEQQKLIVEEHQKEIIDSIKYARRIQTALLPTEKYIEKSIHRLKNK